VGINTGNPELVSPETPLSWVGGVADPKIQAPPHLYHHVKFDSSETNGVFTNRREHQKLGSAGGPPCWGGGVADP